MTEWNSDVRGIDPAPPQGDDLRQWRRWLMDNFRLIKHKLSAAAPYTPTTAGDWDSPQPTTIAAALDQLAARLRAIE